ncbi:sigma-70 family RNA polymerase sigma factor [Aeoliella sp. ICT_H6.2]|uniref:Sigma-70 family RNA polymerase sigma factor n=1 Tax=Aeoliella straminimaris TaxID=2954799 RepID=A0A9X2FA96_9BACT|nr:sigma-70 family RNA polymerase sigma factor [Aeoliella straminimaris]MCO6045302.1 sigma-70 family RNA polymerase sigma factor [Aeoliella straminimaris]
MNQRTKQYTDSYLDSLTQYQKHLHGYILASLGSRADADDVLQKTNLVLLRKESSFPEDGEFLPWAIAIARFEILAFCRETNRERMVFASQLVEWMSDRAAEVVLDTSDRQAALERCLSRLSLRHQEVIKQRYGEDVPLSHIAKEMGRSVEGVKSMLFRLRKRLEQCVEESLSHRLRAED